ncbi:cupredoxin domain-containing protein [Cohnella algarum]|uniref:cupredoxin domain-containing protein n=1 Tax=Cohnella algarum TaxID=2044859 RepID=UPI0019685D5B|nr:cupredoxin domain-containing protein [Cohnella algarum]MBN2981780.1 cupredoxin domain-containing protein [Cohnella algarum]
MKKRKVHLTLTVLIFVAIVTAACGNSSNMGNMDMGSSTSSSPDSSSSDASGNQVSVVASNWKWELSNTTFKVGEQVTFTIQGEEGNHGFFIEGTDIDQQIAAGNTETVTWTPDKAGEYTIRCSVMCGAGHNDMVETLTVME